MSRVRSPSPASQEPDGPLRGASGSFASRSNCTALRTAQGPRLRRVQGLPVPLRGFDPLRPLFFECSEATARKCSACGAPPPCTPKSPTSRVCCGHTRLRPRSAASTRDPFSSAYACAARAASRPGGHVEHMPPLLSAAPDSSGTIDFFDLEKLETREQSMDVRQRVA